MGLMVRRLGQGSGVELAVRNPTGLDALWSAPPKSAALVVLLLAGDHSFLLFGIFLQPVLIDPLFNKFEPLTRNHADLVEQIERVVHRAGDGHPARSACLR